MCKKQVVAELRYFLAREIKGIRLGKAINTNMPIITNTTSNSGKEKPALDKHTLDS